MGQRGAFILFEGLDRSGKTTQARMLVDHLRSKGTPVSFYRFPDRTTQIGSLINTCLTSCPDADGTESKVALPVQSLHLLFSANRWECAARLRSEIVSGVTVVVDRYAHSGMAFSVAQGLDPVWCAKSDEGLPAPDIVLFLDVDAETAEKRGGYGQEIYEKKEMQEKVRVIYEGLANQRNMHGLWKRINASGLPDSVHSEITTFVEMSFHNVVLQPLLSLKYGDSV